MVSLRTSTNILNLCLIQEWLSSDNTSLSRSPDRTEDHLRNYSYPLLSNDKIFPALQYTVQTSSRPLIPKSQVEQTELNQWIGPNAPIESRKCHSVRDTPQWCRIQQRRSLLQLRQHSHIRQRRIHGFASGRSLDGSRRICLHPRNYWF